MMLVITGAAGQRRRLAAERPLPDVPATAHDEQEPRRSGTEEDHLVDRALADSFPASDPPPWTLGLPKPERGSNA